MKLSIITINYNNAEGLRKTMDSVLAQTYKDFDYVIVDGASTDDSVDIIHAYSQLPIANLHEITWLSEPDTGIYNAMNKGIQMASGEYLLFLNSGDFLIADDVLEKVFENECTTDILCARCNVSDNGKVVWTSNPPNIVTFGTLYTVGLAHQSTFIRKSLFEKYGYYDESFRYNADIEFWYRAIVDNGATTQKIDVITTDYNLDGISSTENQTEQYKLEIERILSKPLYQSFVLDYEQWKNERSQYNPLAWILKRPTLMKLLDIYRRILKYLPSCR